MDQWVGKVVSYKNGLATYEITSVDKRKNMVGIMKLSGNRAAYKAYASALYIPQIKDYLPNHKFYYNDKEFVGVLVLQGFIGKKRCIVRKDNEDTPSKSIALLMAWAIINSSRSRTQTKKEIYDTVNLSLPHVISAELVEDKFNTALHAVLMERFMATGGSKRLYKELMHESTN